MKQVIALAALFGFASCGRLDNAYDNGGISSRYYDATNQYKSQYFGQYPTRHIPILRLEENNNGDGTYSYAYATGNGIAAQEQGDARGYGTRAQGDFSYTSPDGSPVQVQYTADERGFQPQGAHLPVAPPVPYAIQRSLQQNLADEARGIKDDGQYRPGPGEKSGAYFPQRYEGSYSPQGYGIKQFQYNRASNY